MTFSCGQYQFWPTSEDLNSSALNEHWVPFSGFSKRVSQLGRGERERKTDRQRQRDRKGFVLLVRLDDDDDDWCL